MIFQIVVGLVIGVIARWLVPGEDGFASGLLGVIITALIGMGGASLGTYIGRAIFRSRSYAAGWLMSITGAVGLVIVTRMLF